MIELDNFRQKYPQYDDMSDEDLANRLANKYPAYKDLPSRLTTQPSQPVSQSPRNDRFQLKSDQPYQSYSYGDALKDTGKTAINSLANLGENLTQPIRHPIQTAKDFASAVAHPIQTARNFGGYVGERYGSPEKIAKTVATDPFGFGADVAGTAYGVKGLTQIKAPKLPKPNVEKGITKAL